MISHLWRTLSIAFFLSATISHADSFTDSANQISDQIQTIKMFGSTPDTKTAVSNAKKVLLHVQDFRIQNASKLNSTSIFTTFELYEQELRDFIHYQETFSQCEKTNADAANRILSSVTAISSVNSCPQNNTSATKGSAGSVLQLHQQIAGQAMLNDLKTALKLKKTYSSSILDSKAVESEVERLCPKADSWCTQEMRNWLSSQGSEYLDSAQFKKITYRSPKTAADHLNKKFTALNFDFVLETQGRKNVDIWSRNQELQSHYSQLKFLYKQDPTSAAYLVEKNKYEALNNQYTRDLPKLKAYQPLIKQKEEKGISLNPHPGLQHGCTKRMFEKELTGVDFQPEVIYSNYTQAYVNIANGEDGMLLYTPALEQNRLQIDGLFDDAKKCPHEYPIQISESQIKNSVDQALQETAKTAALIRKKMADAQKLTSESDLIDAGKDWARTFQPAVAQALATHPEQAQSVCGMIGALKNKENREKLRNDVIIGASCVAGAAMLVVPVAGEAGASATVTAALAFTGTSAGLLAAATNAKNYIDGSQERDLIVSSIMSGNADLKVYTDDQVIRNKVGSAFRQLVIDSAFTAVQAASFLRSISKATLLAEDTTELVADAKNFQAAELEKPPEKPADIIVEKPGVAPAPIVQVKGEPFRAPGNAPTAGDFAGMPSQPGPPSQPKPKLNTGEKKPAYSTPLEPDKPEILVPSNPPPVAKKVLPPSTDAPSWLKNEVFSDDSKKAIWKAFNTDIKRMGPKDFPDVSEDAFKLVQASPKNALDDFTKILLEKGVSEEQARIWADQLVKRKIIGLGPETP